MCEVLSDEETSGSSLASAREDEELQEDSMTKDLIAMILQFMEASGLHESYKAFWSECDLYGFPLPPEGQSLLLSDNLIFGPRDANLLFKYFDFEEKQELLSQWFKFMDAIDPDQQQDFKKITFFVRIFAAIIPFRKDEDSETKSKSMGELRDFFQEKSDEFSTDEKMLSLFALPFVADPAVHPVFKEIFQDSWKSKLRSQLSLSIKKYCEFNDLPTIASTDLVQLYLSPPRQDFEVEAPNNKSRCASTQQDVLSARTLQSLHNNMKTMESSLLDVELRYHKLLKVTAEMVGALEATVQGEAQDMTALQNRVTSVFPELFKAFQNTYRESVVEPTSTRASQQDERHSDFDDEGSFPISDQDLYDSETDPESKFKKAESVVPKKLIFQGDASPSKSYIPPPSESLYDKKDENAAPTKVGPKILVNLVEATLPVSQGSLKSEQPPMSGSGENCEGQGVVSKRSGSRDSHSKASTPPYSLKSTKGGEAFTVLAAKSPLKKRTYAKTTQQSRSPYSTTQIQGKKRWSASSSLHIPDNFKTPVRKPSKTVQKASS